MFNFKIKLNVVMNRNDESFLGGFFGGGTRCLGFFACFCCRWLFFGFLFFFFV